MDGSYTDDWAVFNCTVLLREIESRKFSAIRLVVAAFCGDAAILRLFEGGEVGCGVLLLPIPSSSLDSDESSVILLSGRLRRCDIRIKVNSDCLTTNDLK